MSKNSEKNEDSQPTRSLSKIFSNKFFDQFRAY